jgi:DNA-binding beta-propeller fold protein YncE
MLTAAVATLALLALVPNAALAATQFGTEGEGAGQFNRPSGIAIQQEDGDVFIADEENNRVDQFTAEGSFVRAWGYGVSDGLSNAFQICEAPVACFQGIGGGGGGQLAQPSGIAVDNSAGLAHGSVYVEDPSNHRIERFSEEGQFVLAFGGKVNKSAEEKSETANEGVCPVNPGDACQAGVSSTAAGSFDALGRNAIAVSATGTVYVGDNERVQKFSPAGAVEGSISLPAGAGAVEALAVDSSGNIYALSEGREGVREYDGTGTEVGSPRDPEAQGLAPSITLGVADELFVSDPVRGHIFVYDSAGAQTGTFPVGEDTRGGIALNEGSSTLYVVRKEPPANVRTLTLPPEGPYVLEESQAADELQTTSARLCASVNPEGPQTTEYHFQYGPTEAYGQSTPEEALTPGFEDQRACKVIEGLQPGTTYHFRVVAANALSQSTEGPDEAFTTLPAVSIDSESAAEVSTGTAKLITELNPHGLTSEYHFEYGLSSTYEHSAPSPDAGAGKGTVDVTFALKIQGLSPDSTYHYRVVAHNALGTVRGPDRTFKTQGEQAPPPLPDGRAYEMVSPSAKHGVSLESLALEGGVIEAAKDGGGLAYIAHGPIDEDPTGNRSALYTQLVAKRAGPGAWGTQDIATAHQAPAGAQAGKYAEYRLFSSDLSRGAVEPEGATPLSPASSERTPYLRQANGEYAPLVTGCPPAGEACAVSIAEAANVPAGTVFGGQELKPELFENGVHFVTGTAALTHMLLSSTTSLVQGFETGGEEALYEWGGGKLQAVSVLPNEASASEEGTASVGHEDFQVRGAIADDGSRVFFSTSAQSRLYVRDTVRAQTLRVDKAEAGLKAAEGDATFQLATPDGQKVFFTDPHRLTKDATAKASEPDLYECTIVLSGEELTCRLKDLSIDPHLGEAAAVQGVAIGASEDGRYVYFAAKGALEAGAAASGACPVAGEGGCVNLYAYDTQSNERRLVAVLSEEDFPDWSAGASNFDLGQTTARVSPDGRYIAFMSARSLSGYDNRDARSGARDEEVYLYDFEKNELTCTSCNASGQRPEGMLEGMAAPGPLVDRTQIWGGRWLAGSLPGWERVELSHALHQPRYLTSSGRLVFNSPDALVAADGNGTQDVYEYEPSGVGSCDEASGCVALLSSGTSSEESAFLDASESGDDVFFITAAQLAGEDEDNALDVYDAHVCSVAPGCAPPRLGAPPPCISSDACRAAPAPQPAIYGQPPSQTFNGQGNLTTPPAKPVAKPKALTRAQKLAKALKACKKKRSPRGRAQCEKRARSLYEPKKQAKSKQAKSKARKGSRRGASATASASERSGTFAPSNSARSASARSSSFGSASARGLMTGPGASEGSGR